MITDITSVKWPHTFPPSTAINNRSKWKHNSLCMCDRVQGWSVPSSFTLHTWVPLPQQQSWYFLTGPHRWCICKTIISEKYYQIYFIFFYLTKSYHFQLTNSTKFLGSTSYTCLYIIWENHLQGSLFDI